MDVSENRGTPKIIHFNRVFHYKPSILGYPYFWKHPNRQIDKPIRIGRPSKQGVTKNTTRSRQNFLPGKPHLPKPNLLSPKNSKRNIILPKAHLSLGCSNFRSFHSWICLRCLECSPNRCSPNRWNPIGTIPKKEITNQTKSPSTKYIPKDPCIFTYILQKKSA